MGTTAMLRLALPARCTAGGPRPYGIKDDNAWLDGAASGFRLASPRSL
jgi:hypothetical protein